MSYVIRNIRPSVLHIPDADVRLDSGETAIVESLSPLMEELLANRALEAISSDPDPPVATPAVEATPLTPGATEPAIPVVPEKKTRKGSATPEPEQPNGAE